MSSSLWMLLLYVSLAGAAGGIANSLITDHGFALPRRVKDKENEILVPGFMGNIVLGAIAAAISWGAYGPLAAYFIVGTQEAMKTNTSPDKVGLTVSSLAAAAVVGLGGARWLSNEVDKKLLKASASIATSSAKDQEKSVEMALATPLEAYNIAKSLD